MKKLSAIFLTLTFMLYLGGLQLMYWVKIDNAKHEAAMFIGKHINASNAKDFVFTSSQYSSLEWLEKNKEFIFEGQRYDITTIEYSSSGVKVSCYSDNEETELAKEFQQLANKLFSSHQQSNGSDNDVFSKITKEYLPLSLIFLQPRFKKSISVITTENTPALTSLVANIWHPPATC
ncbi:MAG: hypothetical protein ACLQQ4_02005 [Bacteroidia bacterium]